MKHAPSLDLIQKLVDEQVGKWSVYSQAKKDNASPVITISREPGCNGGEVAERLAREFKLDLYSGKIVEEVAKSAKMSQSVVSTLDEKGRSILDDWLSVLDKDRNLWSYQYMEHLVKVMGTIARHGKAVILGRGSNILIPADRQLSIRLVAPIDVRIKSVAKRFVVPNAEAKKRIALVEADRKAYIRKYFNSDISDPVNYDLVINTGYIKTDALIEIVRVGLIAKNLI